MITVSLELYYQIKLTFKRKLNKNIASLKSSINSKEFSKDEFQKEIKI